MILTSWGYTLTAVSSLSDIISTDEFNAATANRYVGDVRIAPGIKAASLAIRNYCGWHLTGELACKVKWTAQNRGVIPSGNDLVIQLPAAFVSAVSSVTIDGVATNDYFLQTNGLLTIYDVGALDKRDVIEVDYTAGIPSADVIKDLVAQMVTLSLSKSYGVTSEAAGGVSVTYASAWTNGSFNQILDNNAGLLTPYRLKGVF